MTKSLCQVLPLCFFLLLATGCSKNEFASNGGTEKPPQATEAPVTAPNPTTTPSPDINCVPGKTTIAVTAKTPSVDQYATNAKIIYDLIIQDCPGTIPQAQANKIQFDVDAVVSDVNNGVVTQTRVNPLPYKILIDGSSQPLSGSLNQINGSDLFGKTGPEFGHYDSNAVVSFAATQRHAIVEVSITPIRILKPYGEKQLDSSSKTFSINTYFKFGDANAVTVPVIVTK